MFKKIKKIVVAMLMISMVSTILFSCKSEENVKVIEPLYTKEDMKNLPDGIYRVDFEKDNIIEEKDGTYIKAYIYSEDIYDTVELHNMKVGDKIFIGGTETLVEEIHWDKNESRLCINFPSFEEAMEEFRPSESGGTYYITGLDDHHSYTLRGQAKIKMSENLVMKDSSAWGEEEKSIPMKNIKDHVSKRPEGDFWHLNTYLRVESGEVVELVHHYIP